MARTGDRDAKQEETLLRRLDAVLSEGQPGRLVRNENAEEQRLLRTYRLLTEKPELYVVNVSEDDVLAGGVNRGEAE